MRNGDIIMDNKGNIRMILKDNSCQLSIRLAYLYLHSKDDALNGTLSGAEKHVVENSYKESTLIGNITDIIARAKDEAAS